MTKMRTEVKNKHTAVLPEVNVRVLCWPEHMNRALLLWDL